MKEQYKDLKLIIETPTQEAWDKVLDFFEITSIDKACWKPYREYTWLCIFDADYKRPMYADSPNEWSNKYERLTYQEFENRFLNKMENTIDLTGISPEDREVLQIVAENMRKRNEDKVAPPAPEKWTVERVVNEVRPTWSGCVDGTIEEGLYVTYGSSKCRLPTKPDEQKVLAFCQLLTCAHWANEGETSRSKTIIMQQGRFEICDISQYGIDVLKFASYGHAKKFLSIEGIEPLLKTFFGIE